MKTKPHLYIFFGNPMTGKTLFANHLTGIEVEELDWATNSDLVDFVKRLKREKKDFVAIINKDPVYLFEAASTTLGDIYDISACEFYQIYDLGF